MVPVDNFLAVISIVFSTIVGLGLFFLIIEPLSSVILAERERAKARGRETHRDRRKERESQTDT